MTTGLGPLALLGLFGGALLGGEGPQPTRALEMQHGSYDEGTLRSEVLESSAWGLGPTASASLRLFGTRSTRLNLDASGSVMLCDRPFPSGGSRYNGMLQAGPSWTLGLNKGRRLTAGVRWTHISNGQGLGAHNPSFDGRGVFVQYQRELGVGADRRLRR